MQTMSTRKRITELSVAELRTQLSKRGVEAAGDRPALIAKLKKVLQTEGVKPSGSVTRKSAAAAAAVASDVSDAQSAAVAQPVKTNEEPSSSITDGPPDTIQSEPDTSSLEVSMKMNSSATDAETSLAEESSLEIPSTSDITSQQMSPTKDVMPTTSTSANKTATNSAAGEVTETAAIATESAESLLSATGSLADSTALSSPRTTAVPSSGNTKNESTDESADKMDIAGDRSGKSGNDTTSSQVFTNIGSIEPTNAENSLWVSGLMPSFRAADLKQVFSKCGKVVTAKVVTSAKSPGSKCFGFIVMATADEARLAVSTLNNTEVEGQKITVEKDRQKRAIVQPQAAVKPVRVTTTLWINGLSTDTKAADLKMLFIKYGKVTGAKVVTSAKNPGTKCFGLVTMSSAEEAELCIERLNKTEFHGRIISLEKAKSEVKTQTKPSVTALGTAASETTVKDEANKTAVDTATAEKTSQKADTGLSAKAAANTDRPKQDVKKDKNMLSLDKIKEERERERQMQKDRAAREEERRRRDQLDRERRLQQEEASRVARERKRLREEKMRLERERMRAEHARMELERERHRQERELEEQRQLLERQRQQAAQYRSDMKRPSTSADDGYWQASKRQAVEPHTSSIPHNYNTYGSGSSGNYYSKSGQYGTGERRETQLRSRESTGTSGAWPVRSTDQRSSGAPATSYGGTANWKSLRSHTSGMSAGDWQSTSASYRGTSSSYAQVGTNSSRQYGSSTATATGYPYYGSSGSQSYNKWY